MERDAKFIRIDATADRDRRGDRVRLQTWLITNPDVLDRRGTDARIARILNLVL